MARPIKSQVYELVALNKIEVHPRNPRQGDVGAIHESIKRHGFFGTIIVQKSTGYVLAGNHRVIALRQDGKRKVPAMIVDCDDETAVSILLSDNRTSDLASYDPSALFDLLAEASKGKSGLTGTGYDDSDLNDMLSAISDDAPDGGKSDAPSPGSNNGKAVVMFRLMLAFTEPDYVKVVERLERIAADCKLEDLAQAVKMLAEKYASGEDC